MPFVTQRGDKWQSKTLFLAIFDPRSWIVKSAHPVCVLTKHNRFCSRRMIRYTHVDRYSTCWFVQSGIRQGIFLPAVSISTLQMCINVSLVPVSTGIRNSIFILLYIVFLIVFMSIISLALSPTEYSSSAASRTL